MPSCSAILLAGGRSSRMGRDKALLPVGSINLLEYMTNLVAEAGIEDLVISRNDGNPRHTQDIYPGKGPIAGIHAGLERCRHNRVLIIPVDMPLLTPAFLQRLIRTEHDDAHFMTSELPCILTRTESLNAYLLHQLRLTKGVLSVRALLSHVKAAPLESPESSQFLSNTNTPEQWKSYEQRC